MYASRKLLYFTLIAGLASAHSNIPDLSRPVSLDNARIWAVGNDPRLALTLDKNEAAEGQIEQADLPPNPVFGFEMENFWGSGPVNGAEGIEVTMVASQVIETAEKQERRTALARGERDLLEWEREMILARIEADVKSSFLKVLLAQELLDLRQEQLELSEKSERETRRLVEAARAAEVELTRAELSIRKQRFALGKAKREYQSARQSLAALWGIVPAPDFTVEGDVVLEPTLPSLAEFIRQIPSTATMAQYDSLSRTRSAALDLEKANAAPDIELFAGGRYFNEGDGDYGFVAGFEIPIPVFDRNQGNIRTARANLRAVEHEREISRRELLTQISEAYQTLSAAHSEAFAVQSELLEAAEKTLADTLVGYERGQFTQLAVLDSHEILFEIRETYVDALSRYIEAKASIEALTRTAQLKR